MAGELFICFHARALVEPLRVGAGPEDLQDQAVKMQPPPTLLALDAGLFLDGEVADISMVLADQTCPGFGSETCQKYGDNAEKGKWQLHYFFTWNC